MYINNTYYSIHVFQCMQLCDLGEESFLLSVRLQDGKRQHVGSVKGDHFCLLRPEVVQDFHNFCLGNKLLQFYLND